MNKKIGRIVAVLGFLIPLVESLSAQQVRLDNRSWTAIEDGTPWRELRSAEYGVISGEAALGDAVWLKSPTDVASHFVLSEESFTEQDMEVELETWLEGSFNFQSFPFVIQFPFCNIVYYNWTKKWRVDAFDANGVDSANNGMTNEIDVGRPEAGVHYFWKANYKKADKSFVVRFKEGNNGTYRTVFQGNTNWGYSRRDTNGTPVILTSIRLATNDGRGTTFYAISIDGEIIGGMDYHPADANQDSRLDINEVTKYGAAWSRGDRWALGPNPIDINYVTRAGFLWSSGESYTFRVGGSLPGAWVPSN